MTLKSHPGSSSQQTATTSYILDRSRALAAVGGDSRFLSELAGIFEAAYPTLLEGIQR